MSSLRKLEAVWNAQGAHHYHLGSGAVCRSTVSDANARRPSAIFAEVFAALSERAGCTLPRRSGEVLRRDERLPLAAHHRPPQPSRHPGLALRRSRPSPAVSPSPRHDRQSQTTTYRRSTQPTHPRLCLSFPGQPCACAGMTTREEDLEMLFTCRPPGTTIPGRFPWPAHARGKWFSVDIHCHVLCQTARDLVARRLAQHMAVDVDREPFSPRMRRPRKTARDRRARRTAGEQHL